jgi:hypothetical protein
LATLDDVLISLENALAADWQPGASKPNLGFFLDFSSRTNAKTQYKII